MPSLLNAPEKTPLGRRKALADFAKKTPEEIEKMDAKDILATFKDGADLNDEGQPKQKDSSLKIHIELDLEVELHLSARVQGDITIGLL